MNAQQSLKIDSLARSLGLGPDDYEPVGWHKAKLSLGRRGAPSQFRLLFPPEMPLDEKIRTIATSIYGAGNVEFEPMARTRLERFSRAGFGSLPVCIAKTQYSLSDDPTLVGRPVGFRFRIRDARLSAGAGFIYALAGEIQTMPGLPSTPAACRIDTDPSGRIIGLS